MLPGPTILSTFGIDSVPNAIAAIACAPPTLYTFVAPASFAATNVFAVTFPSFPGGVVMMIFFTPATCAGTMFINTDKSPLV